MTQAGSQLRAIQKILLVSVGPDDAFRLFTEEIAAWWPLASHSLEGPDATGCALEGRIGGRLFERDRSGREQVWALVTTWQPGRSLGLSWQAGDLAGLGTAVGVAFEAIGPQRCRVELRHDGWPRHQLDRYVDHQRGWQEILVDGYQAYVLSRTRLSPPHRPPPAGGGP